MTSPELCGPVCWLLVICGYLNIIELKLNYSLSHTSHISRAQSLHVPNGYHVGQCRSRIFPSWLKVLLYSFALGEQDCPQDILGTAFPNFSHTKTNRNESFCCCFILRSMIADLYPQRFRFSSLGMGPENLHLINSRWCWCCRALDPLGSTAALGSSFPRDSGIFWKVGHTSFRCVVRFLHISSTHANVNKQMFCRISTAATPTKSVSFSSYPETDWCPDHFPSLLETFLERRWNFFFMLNLYGKKN